MTLDVLVCTPNHRGPLAQRCLDTLSDTTRGISYTLRIEDNRGAQPFSHACAMNRAIKAADGYLLCLDDDTWFEDNGWLSIMLAAAEEPNVAVVCTEHWRNEGKPWCCGAWFEFNGVSRPLRLTHKRTVVAACGSACWLLCNPPDGLRLHEGYEKYIFDPDYCLCAWELDYKTVSVPVRIFHDSGGVMREFGFNRVEVEARDRKVFVKRWVGNGRLARLYDRIRAEVEHPIPKGTR